MPIIDIRYRGTPEIHVTRMSGVCVPVTNYGNPFFFLVQSFSKIFTSYLQFLSQSNSFNYLIT